MTISKHQIAATVEGVAYEIVHPSEGVVYAHDFGGATEPAAGTSGVITLIDAPSLVVAGRPYTATVQVKATYSGGAPTVGIGAVSPYVTPIVESAVTTSYTEFSVSFVATTDHVFRLGYSNNGATSVSLNIGLLTLTADSYTEAATSYELDIISANLGMDDGWSPYVQGELTCWAPPAEALDLIDPRDDLRVTVTVTKEFSDWNTGQNEDQTRTVDLLLRSREVNHVDGTMTVTVESDEGLLQDFGLVSLSAERVYGLSVKDAVTYALAKIGATLAAGAADADIENQVTAPVVTNLITNPSGETATTGWYVDSGRAVSRVTHASAGGGIPAVNNEGAYFVRYTFTGSLADSGAYYSGNFVAVAGQTYTYSVWVRSSKTQSIVPGMQWNGASAQGPVVPLVAGVWTKLTLTAVAPVGTVFGGPYFYNKAGTGFSNWVTGDKLDVDCLVVTNTTEVVDYFDGATTDTGFINYAWTGTANASSSTRTYLPNSDAMVWSPGVTAWDYLEPLFQSVALRLYCNENREWILEPSGTTREGQVNVAEGFNLTEGTDTISRYREWFDSVVIRYTGNLDVNGQKYTTYDIAGAPGKKVMVVEYDRPTPGLGGAQALLDRALGKGRVLGLTGISDYEVTPGMTVVATLPKSPIQSGLISSVQWVFPQNTMTIGSRGLTDTPLDSWLLAPEAVAWEDVPTGTDWTEYDPGTL